MDEEYYVIHYEMKLGPFSIDELMKMHLEIDTRILSPQTNTWEDACDIPELSAYFVVKRIYFPAKSNLASFWWRLLAYVIDAILLEASALFLLNELALKGKIDPKSPSQMFGCLVAIHLLLIAYNTICETTPMMGSLGKRICGLAVVDIDGGRIRFYPALKRNVFKILSRVLFYIGFLRVLWDEHRQGWHDEFAKTYVVRRRNSR